MLGVELSHAQQPAVRARAVAANGPDSRVTEPAIAAGPDNVVTVFFDEPDYRAWYATRNNWTSKWTWGEIDPNTAFTDFADLSIAYDRVTGGYLAAAQAEPGEAGKRVVTCRFVPDPAVLGRVVPLAWEELPSLGVHADKPWIVAGDPNMHDGQEYYIVYLRIYNRYAYLRSVDGGESWVGGQIKVGENEVQGGWCAQPAVHQDGPLYVAYKRAHGIQFLVGEDQPSGLVTFAELLTTGPVPLRIPLNKDSIRTHVPGQFEPYAALGTIPYLAVDPNNADRLFIAYHDTATDDPNDRDVNVYVHEIVRDDTIWEVGNRIKVNNETTDYESDQFMPEMIVDAAGYVHILFYDDRRFTDGPEGDLQPDDDTPRPKFDAYYAYAPVDNLNFQQPAERNRLLYLRRPNDPNEPPAFDRTLAPNASPREYNGIAWYADRIWTAYTGMSEDEEDNKTLIWSSRIDW